MKETLHPVKYLRIADFDIRIISRRPFAFAADVSLAYRPFVSDAPFPCPENGLDAPSEPDAGDGFTRVEIELSDTGMPTLFHAERVFDSGSAWSVYRKSDRIHIVMALPESDIPLWIAELFPFGRNITLYCGPELCNHNGCLAIDPTGYPLDQIVLLHLLAESGGGGIIHAAGGVRHQAGWVFAGVSGAGKSTMATLLDRTGKWLPLSDDRVVIRKTSSGYRVYGTPWPGEAGFAENRNIPLKGIFLLEKGKDNRIEPVRRADAAPALLPVLSVPWYDAQQVDRMLGFCEHLIAEVPVRRLVFRPEPGAVDLLHAFLSSLPDAR